MTSPDPIQATNDRLALLYHLSQTFNSSLDLDEVLSRVMDEVIAATHAERGFVMLTGSGEDVADLTFRAARGLDQQTIEEPRFQVSRSIVERVARQGKPLLTSDAQADDRFNIRQSVVYLGLRSILCVPLSLKDRVIGVIYVDNRLQAGIFTQADLELLTAIASSAAIAIENARLYQVAVEKGRLERELQMARKVQASLLPAEMPQIPGWEFTAQWRPAREVAGDYYDFMRTSSPGYPDALGLVIADVTDKGLPAALFMVFTRSVVRNSLARAASPAEGITQANQVICSESTHGLFVTLVYAYLDPPSGELTYVNAGHNPPLYYRAGGDRLSYLSNTGIPLGVEEISVYTQRTILLEPGDFVLFYTDGVTEAIDSAQQEYGLERLEGALLAARDLPAGEMLAALEGDIRRFTGPAAPFDDITILLVKRL
jgi:sigma-B regulation protein RsbU (phosphoserine phosphatase)